MATSAFGKAFRAAREAGDTEFEFGGKRYNTKMKEENSAPAKKAEPKAIQEVPKTPAPNYNDSIGSKFSLGDIALKASRQAEANRAAMEANRPPPVPRKKSMLEEAREEATRRASAAQDYEESKSASSPTPARRFDGKGPGLGALSNMKKGGFVSASSRADGIAQRGKTRGKMC